jgi:hypothetical protein
MICIKGDEKVVIYGPISQIAQRTSSQYLPYYRDSLVHGLIFSSSWASHVLHLHHTETPNLSARLIAAGVTVTLAVALAAGSASFTFPAACVEGRVLVAALVSAASMVGCLALVLSLATEIRITWDVGVAVVTASAVAVAGASSWAVGVMVCFRVHVPVLLDLLPVLVLVVSTNKKRTVAYELHNHT